MVETDWGAEKWRVKLSNYEMKALLTPIIGDPTLIAQRLYKKIVEDEKLIPVSTQRDWLEFTAMMIFALSGAVVILPQLKPLILEGHKLILDAWYRTPDVFNLISREEFERLVNERIDAKKDAIL